jgi:TetR/AcrR family tetracycline transcriptional repressor
VSAAVRTVREDGYEQMTIRRLAAELGVAPMSLYRHVRDKDDILDDVLDRLLASEWRPDADPADWKAWITEASDRLRNLLVTEPAALHVYLAHPVICPSAIARMDAMIEVLRASLPDEQAVRRAYAAIQTYTIGFAALEASRAGWDSSGSNASELAKQLAAYTSPHQFAIGFQYLLAGIEGEGRA